jgi:dCTP diphosphatase
MNDFNEASKSIKEFCEEREWSKFHDPKNLALSLSLESMEVLELFQWTKDNEINPDKLSELPDELADVLYWVIMLSNHYDIDLIESLKKKMEKNREKYPIDKAKGVSKKYTEL